MPAAICQPPRASLLDKMRATFEKYDAKFKELDATLKEHEARHVKDKEEIQALQRDVGKLKVTSKGYLQIRDRSLSFFRRDVLEDARREDIQKIEAGNISAHGGDAIRDASLYRQQLRRDELTFGSMYGIGSMQVSELGWLYLFKTWSQVAKLTFYSR